MSVGRVEGGASSGPDPPLKGRREYRRARGSQRVDPKDLEVGDGWGVSDPGDTVLVPDG